MALFGPVEQRSGPARALHAIIYVVLTVGSVSMVYPFLLMIGASVTTEIDFEDWRIIPAYLTDDAALYRKWMDDRYGDYFAVAKRIHRLAASNFRSVESIPDYGVERPEVQRRVEDWLECVKELPDDVLVALHQDLRRTRITNQRYTAWLDARYKGAISEFNARFATVYDQFSDIAPFESPPMHKARPETSPLRLEYLEFRRTLPPSGMLASLASDGFIDYIERHIGLVDEVNRQFGTEYKSSSEIIMPVVRPEQPGLWRDLWDLFVIKRYPLVLTRIEGNFDEAFRAFLATKHRAYDARVTAYNAEHGTGFPRLADVTYPHTMPIDDLRFADWVEFTDAHVPAQARQLVSVEGIWRDRLRKTYGSLEGVNEAHGTQWASWEEVMPPRAETDVLTFTSNIRAIRSEFLARNYRLVLRYILFHGRALFNTFVLVVLTILGHLTVQPMAAYGLSRFNLSYSHKILLALLATMAFPAEVAMIPNFLMIKELGLLNTYWALVLPGLASGMGIFLLKGYFDSLPKELYEAAMMDGAGELRMFLQITIPLSKPILAVIALASFGAAYGGFIWAFLICQKPTMWTLMVFLWELGNLSTQSVWMASLVIAALPTLLVFIFCQRIILRGIIVPTMK